MSWDKLNNQTQKEFPGMILHGSCLICLSECVLEKYNKEIICKIQKLNEQLRKSRMKCAFLSAARKRRL